MNLLRRGDAMLSRLSLASAGETVAVYRASAVIAEAWHVIPGQTRIEIVTDGQISVVGDRHDWIGDPAELQYLGDPTELQRGDRLEWLTNGLLFTFEAQPADGENVWSWHGPSRLRIRSHWKLIDWRRNE